MKNLAEYLLTRPFDDDHIQSYFENEPYTLGDYRKVVPELVEQLEAQGFQKNTSALLIFDDSPLCLALYLACMTYGIAPVIASTMTLDSVVDRSIDAADFSAVFSDGSRDFSAVSSRVSVGKLEGSMRAGSAVLTLVSRPDDQKPVRIDTDRIAYFLMTSGSTGLPKIVEHSHGGIAFTSRVYAEETLGIGPDDRIYSMAKTSFGYGLANNCQFPFATGASAYLYRAPFSTEEMFRHLEEYRPTVVFGIPTAYRMILDYVSAHPEERSKLEGIHTFISAGEPLREDIAREWKELTGHFIKDNMGSSEASAILLNEGSMDKFGSAGKPVKGSEVRLIGADGKDSDAGALYFKSEGNAIGYYKDPVENAIHFKDGYLITGDVFTIDEDGYYWYKGREDNMMKYHGFWVFPQGIEELITAYPGVSQAVVTKATINGLDILTAALVTDSSFTGIDGLRASLEKELEIYKQPKKYLVFDKFPLNERGKTDLKKIKELMENAPEK